MHHSFCYETLMEFYVGAVLQNTTSLQPVYGPLIIHCSTFESLFSFIDFWQFTMEVLRGEETRYALIIVNWVVYKSLTSIITIYNASSYPTYQKSSLMRKFKTYDRTYKIVTFHQSYKKCLHLMFLRFLIFLVTTRYDAFTRSYEFDVSRYH